MARIREIPSRAEQLALEPTISAEHRAELARGAAEWDAGSFFDAHETWEDIWQVERRPIRSFYQGLILLAAGLHHWTGTRRPRGVRIKLSSGIERLAPYAPSYLGVNVSMMIADAAALLRQAPRPSSRVGRHAAGLFPAIPLGCDGWRRARSLARAATARGGAVAHARLRAVLRSRSVRGAVAARRFVATHPDAAARADRHRLRPADRL